MICMGLDPNTIGMYANSKAIFFLKSSYIVIGLYIVILLVYKLTLHILMQYILLYFSVIKSPLTPHRLRLQLSRQYS